MPSLLPRNRVHVPLFLLCTLFLLNACQKSTQDLPVNSDLPSVAGKTNASIVQESAQVATDWYKLQIRMMLLANPATNNALNAESFAYIGIGLYESVRSGIKNSISLSSSLYLMPDMPQKDNNGYDLVVSANAALASMVRSMYTGLTTANLASIDSLENTYNQKSLPMNSEKFQRSQAYGRAVATAIRNWAITDQFNISNAGYVTPTSPVGVWVPTPPLFGAIPVLPFISNSRPLLWANGIGVTPPLPFAYSESPSSDFYKMVRDVYDLSLILTTDQRNMALYWNDVGVGVGYTPVGHIMNVVTQAIEQTGANLGTAAQAYARAGIAMRDANIVLFRSKYMYNVLRPVSYIRKLWDPAWLPAIPTPAHPEYPSAHAFITGATMRAASGALGNVPVVDHTYDFRGFEPRPFSSLDKVADESGNSRRYAGIHYLPSIIFGLAEGRIIGDRVKNIKLTE
jgi:hypothetical protein